MPAGVILLHQSREKLTEHLLVAVQDTRSLPMLRDNRDIVAKIWEIPPQLLRNPWDHSEDLLRSLCPNCLALTPAAPSAEATPPPAGAQTAPQA